MSHALMISQKSKTLEIQEVLQVVFLKIGLVKAVSSLSCAKTTISLHEGKHFITSNIIYF